MFWIRYRCVAVTRDSTYELDSYKLSAGAKPRPIVSTLSRHTQLGPVSGRCGQLTLLGNGSRGLKPRSLCTTRKTSRSSDGSLRTINPSSTSPSRKLSVLVERLLLAQALHQSQGLGEICVTHQRKQDRIEHPRRIKRCRPDSSCPSITNNGAGSARARSSTASSRTPSKIKLGSNSADTAAARGATVTHPILPSIHELQSKSQ